MLGQSTAPESFSTIWSKEPSIAGQADIVLPPDCKSTHNTSWIMLNSSRGTDLPWPKLIWFAATEEAVWA